MQLDDMYVLSYCSLKKLNYFLRARINEEYFYMSQDINSHLSTLAKDFSL